MTVDSRVGLHGSVHMGVWGWMGERAARCVAPACGPQRGLGFLTEVEESHEAVLCPVKVATVWGVPGTEDADVGIGG